MMLAPIPSAHRHEGDQYADRQHDDGDEGAADVKQEGDRHQRNEDDRLLDARRFQRLDGGLDQFGAIIDGYDLRAVGEAALDLGKALLDTVDDRQGVFAGALKHDAARDLSLAVQFGDAAPLVGDGLHPGHVADPERNAGLGHQDDVLDTPDTLQVTLAPHHELEFG
jgi:hypothetical protein